jgi:hypothetical protein
LWAVAIVQHRGSADASDYCFTAPERLLAPPMAANASMLTMPRSAVAMLLECAVVRFRGGEPECCWVWKAVAAARGYGRKDSVARMVHLLALWRPSADGRSTRLARQIAPTSIGRVTGAGRDLCPQGT